MDNYAFEAPELQKQLCFPIYAASREVIKQYRSYLEPIDLTYTQYITMMVIWEEKKINVKSLGTQLFLDSGTLTPVLKSLESKGFIRRYRSHKDERILLVELTEEGEALKEKAVHIPYELCKKVNLTHEEAQQLHRLLYKVLEPHRP